MSAPATASATSRSTVTEPSRPRAVPALPAHLFVQATNQGEFEVYPETETSFFYRVVKAQLSFELPGEGPATSVTLHQNGRDLRGRRIK